MQENINTHWINKSSQYSRTSINNGCHESSEMANATTFLLASIPRPDDIQSIVGDSMLLASANVYPQRLISVSDLG